MMIKVNLAELKKAVKWIETNTHDEIVSLFVDGGAKLHIKTKDKYEAEVEITLYSTDAHMLPKIKKSDNL